MNYLTNYYKNLSEQLQEQVNQLENILDEARKMTTNVKDVRTGKMVPTRKVDIEDYDSNTGEDAPLIMGRLADNKGKGAQKTRQVSFYAGGSLPGVHPNEEDSAAYELGRNWAGPMDQNVFARAAGRSGAEPLDVRDDVLEVEPREKGHHIKGRGKKTIKKKLAQIRAKHADKSQFKEPRY